jgi:hypothetical protein
MLEIQVLTWEGHKNVAGFNQLMGSQPSHLDNQKTIHHLYTNNKKPAQISFHFIEN